MPTSTVQVNLPIPIALRLQAEAERRGTSMSALVRAFIIAGLDVSPPQPAHQQRVG